MKRMKKFAALLLVVAMTFGMVACSSSDKKEESTKKETKTEEKSTKKLDGTLKVVTTGVERQQQTFGLVAELTHLWTQKIIIFLKK